MCKLWRCETAPDSQVKARLKHFQRNGKNSGVAVTKRGPWNWWECEEKQAGAQDCDSPWGGGGRQ